MNLERNLASNAVGISWPLATGTGRRSWEAAGVSSCVIRRVLSRDVHILKGGKKVKEKSDTFVNCFTKARQRVNLQLSGLREI